MGSIIVEIPFDIASFMDFSFCEITITQSATDESLSVPSPDSSVTMTTVRTPFAFDMLAIFADVSIWVEQGEKAEMPAINVAAMQGYIEQMTAASESLGIKLPENIFEVVLRMPEVIARKEVYEATDDEWSIVLECLNKAIEELLEFRRQEGVALAGKFQEKIANISSLLASVEPFEKERVEKIRLRIKDTLEKFLNVEYDNNRFEQELIFYIEKLDVNEEKQRLANHLEYFVATMNDERGQGKKLGFIAQEMGREINTLGSKSNHAEMQNIVVKMKDELEQIKEQVLNVM